MEPPDGGPVADLAGLIDLESDDNPADPIEDDMAALESASSDGMSEYSMPALQPSEAGSEFGDALVDDIEKDFLGGQSDSEGDIEGNFLQGTSDDWPSAFASVVHVACPRAASQKFEKPLVLATACSGTDSPVVAATQVLGEANVSHLFSCDKSAAARAFVEENFNPDHVYEEVSELLQPTAHCLKCNGPCSGHRQECDLFVAGFPCTPYSGMNPKRWREDFEFMKDPQARPFLDISQYLQRDNPQPPKIAMLENVASCLQPSKKGKAAPVEFILWGRLRRKERKVKYGLKLLRRYHVVQLPLQSCLNYGLPTMRKRVIWVLLRKDLYSEDDGSKILEKINIINSYRLPMTPIKDFMAEEDSDGSADRVDVKRPRIASAEMTRRSIEKSQAVRQAFGLPPMSSSEGSPFTAQASAEDLAALAAREADVLDIAYLLCMKREHSLANMAIDVSQNVGRLYYMVNGRIPSPTTNSKIVVAGNLVSFRTMMRALGWPRNRLKVPPLSDSNLRTLTGNILSAPVFGGALLAVLASVPIGKLDARL